MAEQDRDIQQATPRSDKGGDAEASQNTASDTKLSDYAVEAQMFDDLEPLANEVKLPEKHREEHIPPEPEDIENEENLLYGTIHRGNFLTDDNLLENLPSSGSTLSHETASIAVNTTSTTEIPHQVAHIGEAPDIEALSPVSPRTEQGEDEIIDALQIPPETSDGIIGNAPPLRDIAQAMTENPTTGGMLASDDDTSRSDDDGTELVADETPGKVLQGSDDADFLVGGPGDDTFYGGAGDDVMTGNAGDDVFYGGAGNDIASGDAGNDLFIFGQGNGTDHFSGGSGWTDTIQLEGIDVGPEDDVWTLQVEGDINWVETETGLEFDESASGSIELGDGSTLSFEDIDRIDWSSG